MRKQLIVGIDPDIDKSGVAILDTIHDNKITLYNLTFFELYEKLCAIKTELGEEYAHKLIVVIEGGWLIEKSNFHSAKNAKSSDRISKNVGANHETGKKIVEMCNYLNIVCCIKKPLRKIWKGPERKITHQEIISFTGIKTQTNQETRDAALLAWDYAGLPIRCSTLKQNGKALTF